MSAKDIVFKHAERAISDAQYGGMGTHDGNARIHYGHIQWMMDRITELEQQLQQARREGKAEGIRLGWEQGMLRAAEICEARFESIEGSAEGYEYGCAMEIRKEAEDV